MSDIYRELLWLFGIGLVTENKAMFYSCDLSGGLLRYVDRTDEPATVSVTDEWKMDWVCTAVFKV